MPGKWQAHWPIRNAGGAVIVENDDDPVWSNRRDERFRMVDRAGNLTLVTGSFNRNVSNLGWVVKQREFQKQKSLVINYAIASSPSWDEAQVDSRGHELAAAAIQIWPAPGALMSNNT